MICQKMGRGSVMHHYGETVTVDAVGLSVHSMAYITHAESTTFVIVELYEHEQSV
jgi:hypothetical protein